MSRTHNIFADVDRQTVTGDFLAQTHTMSEEALAAYVTGTKLSQSQQSMLQEYRGLDLEVHALAKEHIDAFLEKERLDVLEVAHREPRREKTYNFERPSFYRCQRQNGEQVLCVFCFPSEEYVTQYAEVLAAYLCFDQKTGKFSELSQEELSIPVCHYPHVSDNITVWSGLKKVASNALESGDLVIMGHADEFISAAANCGYAIDTEYDIETMVNQPDADGRVTRFSQKRSFGRLVVLRNNNQRRIVVAAFVESFWGRASGKYARCFAEAGATDIIYMSKCGTLVSNEMVHGIAVPQYFHLIEPTSDFTSEPVIRKIKNLSECLEHHGRLISDHFANAQAEGIHLTVPTVLGETFEQAQLYAGLHPATIDNEDAHIAKELEELNQIRGIGEQCHFTAFHFITDYLITRSYREGERSPHDLAEISANKRRLQNKAFKKIASAICIYADRRTLRRDPLQSVQWQFAQPTASGEIVGRSSILQTIGAEIERLGTETDPPKRGGWILRGPPTIGKSSIASALFEKAANTADSRLWIDCRKISDAQESDVAALALALVNEIDVDAEGGLSPDDADYNAVLERLRRSLNDRPSLLIFDNFEGQLNQSGAIRSSRMKALIETILLTQSVCILTSTEPVKNVSTRILQRREVGGLNKKEFRQLARSLNWSASAEVIDAIHTYVEGNPKVAELVYLQNRDAIERGAELNPKILDLECPSVSGLIEKQYQRLRKDDKEALLAFGILDSSIIPFRRDAINYILNRDARSSIERLIECGLVEEGEQHLELRMVPYLESMMKSRLEDEPSLKKRYANAAFRFYSLLKPTARVHADEGDGSVVPGIIDPREWQNVLDASVDLERLRCALAGGQFRDAAKIMHDEMFRRGLNRIGAYDAMAELYGSLADANDSELRKAKDVVPFVRGRSLDVVGIALRAMNRPSDAIEKYKKALRSLSAKRAPEHRARVLGNLTYAYISLGTEHRDEAIRVGNKAVELAKQLVREDPGNHGHKRSLAFAHGNLGVAYLEDGKQSKALKHLRNDIDVSLALGDNPEGVASARGYLAIIVLRKSLRLGLRNIASCLDFFRSIGNVRREFHFVCKFLTENRLRGTELWSHLEVRSEVLRQRLDGTLGPASDDGLTREEAYKRCLKQYVGPA